MPTMEARSEYLGAVCIPGCSHITNESASGFVRTSVADTARRCSYIANVARRGIPKRTPVWYLPEWMAACGLEGRGAQVRMMALTGWSRATMSQLYTGKQDFNSEILATAAQALEIEPHELLMPPERAMALRQLRDSAAVIVKSTVVAEERKTGTNG